jgi:hypothetical protein
MHELHRGSFEAYEEVTRGTEAAALVVRCGQLYVSEHEGRAGLGSCTRACARWRA